MDVKVVVSRGGPLICYCELDSAGDRTRTHTMRIYLSPSLCDANADDNVNEDAKKERKIK